MTHNKNTAQPIRLGGIEFNGLFDRAGHERQHKFLRYPSRYWRRLNFKPGAFPKIKMPVSYGPHDSEVAQHLKEANYYLRQKLPRLRTLRQLAGEINSFPLSDLGIIQYAEHLGYDDQTVEFLKLFPQHHIFNSRTDFMAHCRRVKQLIKDECYATIEYIRSPKVGSRGLIARISSSLFCAGFLLNIA